MNDKKTHAGFWQGKAFYVALAIIIGGAAIASFLSVSSMLQGLQTPQTPNSIAQKEENTVWQQPTQPINQKQEDVPVSSAAPSASPNTSSSDAPSQDVLAPSAEPIEAQGSPTPSFISPLGDTNTLQGFSGDTLIYNETLGDWRTHNGVDLAGREGQTVKCPLEGVVTKAEYNELWGSVVTIEANGYTVRLYGLQKSLYVQQGQAVKQGDTLGKLGTPAAESRLGSHLHCEIEKDGALLNPAQYL